MVKRDMENGIYRRVCLIVTLSLGFKDPNSLVCKLRNMIYNSIFACLLLAVCVCVIM